MRGHAAQLHLVRALRSLRALPGNIVPRPSSLLRNLFEQVRWQLDLVEDPKLLQEELEEMRCLLWSWELLDPVVAASTPRRSWFRRVRQWLRGGHDPRWTATSPRATGHETLTQILES